MIKKVISLLIVFCIVFSVVSCSALDVAKDKAAEAKDGVVNWYESLDFTKFEDGWNNSLEFVGSQYSAAVSSEYIASVQSAITELKTDMNASYGSARGTAQEAGLLAEKWAADTFNINSIANGSSESASVVGSNDLGSVDVTTTYGENASLKYYQSANGSAQAQAQDMLSRYREYCASSSNPKEFPDWLNDNGYNPETMDELVASLTPVYDGQTRIIPADQIAEASAYLEGRVDTLTASGENAEIYQQTLDSLRDRLQAPDGTESTPITYEELQAVTELAQAGEFEPEEFGIEVSKVISPKYVVKQAIGTGLTTAALNTVFTVGPDVYTIIKEAAESGDIDEDELQEVGVEGAIAASEGLVEGSVCNVVTSLCQSGALGAALADANPSVVATITIVVIEAAINGYKLSKGEITPEEYGNMMADRLIIGLISVPTVELMVALCAVIKIPMLVGCIAGTMIACVGYTIAKDAVMDIVDGGGFEAIVPEGAVDSFSVAREIVEDLNIGEQLSSFGDTLLSTANDGLIMVQGLLGE